MPRDIPVGNGQMLVTFDHHYQIRDIYYPHVGQENHAGGGPCRFGVLADLPNAAQTGDRRRRRLFWSYEGWRIGLDYQPNTLASDVQLEHDELMIRMECTDAVDFHQPLLVRRITLTNLHDQPRQVIVYHHNDFHMFGTKVGDTACFDPKLRSLVHYRGKRYLMVGFFADGEQRIDQYATGVSGFHGAEGTWRDAEDGVLGNNPIAQGAVDSTIGLNVELPACNDDGGGKTVYLILGCGQSREDLVALHQFIHDTRPQNIIDRTASYWRLWVGGQDRDFADLPQPIVDLYHRSLLVLRTQIDNSGAIIAANDSDIMQFARDTYSYLWPRDGALVAHALDRAGFTQVSRRFYSLCAELITPEGYFHHKYNPDGSPASSWHPWIADDLLQLPIQEDETALVLWALWKHYDLTRDIEFVRLLWTRLIGPAADFIERFRDPATGLPLPSYDLWEERWGVHAFTVAAVYGGLVAARNFAVCFGDRDRADRYAQAARQVRDGFCRHMWSESHGRFLRRIMPNDAQRTSALISRVMAGEAPESSPSLDADPPTVDSPDRQPVSFEVDDVVDSSLFGIYKFGMLSADDDRVANTMQAVERQLWVKTPVGGLARYEKDMYHRVTDDSANVPGNPWYICTLWLADWHIARAATVKDLNMARPILRWVITHSLPSGVLAEQVHPHTNAALSVSPLTWSHATVVDAINYYLKRYRELSEDGQGQRDVVHLGRVDRTGSARAIRTARPLQGAAADSADRPGREAPDVAFAASFDTADQRITVSIDPADCIGCQMCVFKCQPNVLKMVEGRAMVDLNHLADCSRCGDCVEFCPTDVVQVAETPLESSPSTSAVHASGVR